MLDNKWCQAVQAVLEAIRVLLTLVFFSYALFSDLKTREVSNNVWIIFAPLAFVLTFIELFFYDFSWLPTYGICFGFTSAFAIALFYSGGFGGADAKALMCLALALPFYPQILFKPVFGESSPIQQILFPVTVFSNSVLFAAASAVFIFLYNMVWHKKNGRKIFDEDHKKESWGKKVLVLITGYRFPVGKLREKWHLYPLEDVEEDENGFKRKLVVVPKDEERNAMVERLAKAVEVEKIKDMVWATPGLPMLIFMTLGLIVALVFGDVIWTCIRLLLGQY